MKNKLSKILWGIWIAIGILIAIIFLGAFFSAVGKGDLGGAIAGTVMLAVGVYILLIYLAITVLLLIIWGIIRLIKRLSK
jgi:hypothetical protein